MWSIVQRSWHGNDGIPLYINSKRCHYVSGAATELTSHMSTFIAFCLDESASTFVLYCEIIHDKDVIGLAVSDISLSDHGVIARHKPNSGYKPAWPDDTRQPYALWCAHALSCLSRDVTYFADHQLGRLDEADVHHTGRV